MNVIPYRIPCFLKFPQSLPKVWQIPTGTLRIISFLLILFRYNKQSIIYFLSYKKLHCDVVGKLHTVPLHRLMKFCLI